MRNVIAIAVAAGLLAVAATPAIADAQPTARDIQAAVDSYLAESDQDVNLVGGPGSAGYDGGFWIKGGDFSLKINLTLQARYEAWLWDSTQIVSNTQLGTSAGDHSGFSLPRATLKFSGTAPCNINYYMELEFGHYGEDLIPSPVANALGPLQQSLNFDSTREAWIEWSMSDLFNFRMGQIKTAATRQLMTPPEMQQFVDIALPNAYMGSLMPGYTDRNRDHGFAIHGVFGCNNEFSYLFTVTNGDGGDSIRNLLDPRTSDNLAFSGRLNWAFLNPIGYQEGALRQTTCSWYGEIGAWGYYYADRFDLPHTQVTDAIRWGVDLALGYGGFSMTGAYNAGTDEDGLTPTGDADYTAWFVQLGYHFPGTAWELAGRYGMYETENAVPAPAFALAVPGGALGGPVGQHPLGEGSVTEFAFAVNYYLNGHGNKMTLDASFVSGDDPGSVFLFDPYAGYVGQNAPLGAGADDYGILLRFQWQLAL